MDYEFVKERLQRSAERSSQIWAEIKARFSNQLLESDDTFTLVDIQDIDEDCVDFIFIRKNKDLDLDQLERCRIVVERRLFRKPRIKTYIESGPFAKDFFENSADE